MGIQEAAAIRMSASALLAQAKQRDAAQAATYKGTAGGRILFPTTSTEGTQQAPRPNQALEDAALKLGMAHSALTTLHDALIKSEGSVAVRTLMVSAEITACVRVMTAISGYLQGSALSAGAAAALDGRIPDGFTETKSGLIIPKKAA